MILPPRYQTVHQYFTCVYSEVPLSSILCVGLECCGFCKGTLQATIMDELGRNQFKEVNQPINIYVCLTKIIKPLMIVLPVITMICIILIKVKDCWTEGDKFSTLSPICLIGNDRKGTDPCWLRCINQTNPSNLLHYTYVTCLSQIKLPEYYNSVKETEGTFDDSGEHSEENTEKSVHDSEESFESIMIRWKYDISFLIYNVKYYLKYKMQKKVWYRQLND